MCFRDVTYRVLLEVRHGDELHQVARWHCQRYSLGMEKVPVLSEQLEKVRKRRDKRTTILGTRLPLDRTRSALLPPSARWFACDCAILISSSTPCPQDIPQHADPEWVSARAADRSCSVPAVPTPHSPASPTTSEHAGDRSIALASEVADPDNGPTNFVAASPRGERSGVSDGEGAGEGRAWHADRGHEDGRRGGGDNEYDEGGGCVTLAITTCKRLRAFMGTAEGLQARFSNLLLCGRGWGRYWLRSCATRLFMPSGYTKYM